ncbi:hypothetical protein BGZ83_006600 [Gryganskiella cystojenkinii]|nr:hypothetical protein BGZ83_006600 [Gryganskiella cystojenkinii]
MIALANFSGNPADASWTSDFLPSNAKIENGNLVLTLLPGSNVNKFGNKPGFGATVSSTRWMLYGTVTARIKSGSPSRGIVSSFIYRSALTGDEIDYEWVGQYPSEVQSNYYYHTPSTMDPKDIDYSHSRRHSITTMQAEQTLLQDYQTYTIEWLPDKLTWYINGQVVRTVLKSEVGGTQYPDTPSQIQFSIWDGGLGDPATMEWAGGPTDWSPTRQPYQMYVDSVDIVCYSPADPDQTWPPEDQGFQNFVNPLDQNPQSPLRKDAIVLGDNAPTFSTFDQGGLHWGRFLGGGKSLVGGRYPIPTSNKKNSAMSRFEALRQCGRTSGTSRWEIMVVALSAIAIAFFGLA